MPRRCSVCDHPERETIDRALLADNAPYRSIAKQFGVSAPALYRHKCEHLAERMARAAETSKQADVRTAIDVVAQLKAINGTSFRILHEARQTKDHGLALRAIDRIHRQIELQGRMIDLIDSGTTINITVSAQWVTLRGTIMDALAAHPEARHAVAAALASLDAGPRHAA